MGNARLCAFFAALSTMSMTSVVACNHFDATDEFRECPECFADGGGEDVDGATNDGGVETIVVADAELPECPPDAPDLDKDDHVANNVGLACGDDCDDIEPRAHPGETDWFTFAAELADFDWNCNGIKEKHFTDLAVCANPTTPGDPCVFTEGWLGATVPICGYTAQWVTSCAELSGPGTCGVPSGGLTPRTQECR
jgi:hypothetical protein